MAVTGVSTAVAVNGYISSAKTLTVFCADGAAAISSQIRQSARTVASKTLNVAMLSALLASGLALADPPSPPTGGFPDSGKECQFAAEQNAPSCELSLARCSGSPARC